MERTNNRVLRKPNWTAKEGNNWVNKYRVSKGNDEPDYYIQDTVVEWFDSLDNYDLMKLTMWCIEHKISTPYNFR